MVVTYRRLAVGAIAALAVAGCTATHANRGLSPSPTSSPAQRAAVGTSTDSVVVAAGVGLDVVLYRVAEDHVAHVVATLRPPSTGAPFAAQEISLTAGSRPDACVLWHTQHEARLLCYPFGRNPTAVLERTVDATKQSVQGISLSGDGTRVAWIEAPHAAASDDSSNDRVLVTARFAHGVVTERHEELVYPDSSSSAAPCQWPFATSWLGRTRVLLSCSGEDDANGGYVIADVAMDGHAAALVEHHLGRFNQFVGLSAYTPTQALAIENEYCNITCPDHKAPAAGRAVRVDLRTGVVTDVLGIAAAGRAVNNVLGGEHGVVYDTVPINGRGPTRTYLRLPGDRYGKPIEGLRGDVLAAQP